MYALFIFIDELERGELWFIVPASHVQLGSCLGLPEMWNREGDWGGVGKETNQSSCFDTNEGREIKAELLEVT